MFFKNQVDIFVAEFRTHYSRDFCTWRVSHLRRISEPNRYWYPTLPAHYGNGLVNHSLSKLRDSVRGPVLSLPRSLPQRCWTWKLGTLPIFWTWPPWFSWS